MNRKRVSIYTKSFGRKVAAFFKSEDVVTFLFFLLLASFLWLMHTTGTQREMRSKIYVRYIGVPDDIRLDKPLPKQIDFVIQDEGKQLWSYFSYSFDSLTVDLTQKFTNDKKIEIEFDVYMQKILSQLSPSAKIVELTPGYFASTYSILNIKQVDVILSSPIRLNPQYVLLDPVTISPSKTTISGNKEALDTIHCVHLEPITEIFSRSTALRCDIMPQEGINIKDRSATVTIPVEISTERELTLPIKILNTPADCYIRTFPTEVHAIFNVGLSKYKSITEDMVEVTFDYNDIADQRNRNTNELKISKLPADVHNLRISPQKVEYVIEKNK